MSEKLFFATTTGVCALCAALLGGAGCSSSDGAPGPASGSGGIFSGSGGANGGIGGTGSVPGSNGGASGSVGSSGSGAGSAAGTGATSSSSGGSGGTTGGGGGTSPGNGGTSGSGGVPDTSGPVVVDTTPGRWRTALNAATGRFDFISPEGAPSVVRGISMTGLETGTRQTAAGAGFWLYLSNQAPESTNAKTVLENVVQTVVTDWSSNVVRIPICGSAWTQNYVVKDWGNAQVATYRDWVDVAVKQARASGAVVIIDNHLWAVGKMGKGGGVDRGTFTSNGQQRSYADYEDGCTGVNKVSGTDSCAPQDWYTGDASVWQCAIANADGVTMHNAFKNKDSIATMWTDIAGRYKSDSGVWFELFNEPYNRKADKPFPAEGVNEEDKDYPWDLWTAFMQQNIAAIRDQAQSTNMVIVNGLDWGYDFGPEYGPIHDPGKYLPWKSRYANIAYAFHPYQHGACCGDIGAAGTDLSSTDPYESGFCSFYKDGTDRGAPSGAALPGGKSCTNAGYAATQDKKMPPCTWVASAFNPKTGAAGLCAGDRTICNAKTEAECTAVDWASPGAGGWSKYVLPMAKYGPLIATEFGSFDCSSGYVKTLLKYMEKFGISYTAWALWPQNSGGPPGLGSCGYPAVMMPSADPGDFRQCFDAAGCKSMMKPLPHAGAAVFQDLQSH
jgi:aryl-phospho-beta-D-glucosidase BglC (GH1 family)